MNRRAWFRGLLSAALLPAFKFLPGVSFEALEDRRLAAMMKKQRELQHYDRIIMDDLVSFDHLVSFDQVIDLRPGAMNWASPARRLSTDS